MNLQDLIKQAQEEIKEYVKENTEHYTGAVYTSEKALLELLEKHMHLVAQEMRKCVPEKDTRCEDIFQDGWNECLTDTHAKLDQFLNEEK